MPLHARLPGHSHRRGAVIQLEIQKNRFANLDEIGMRSKMQEQLKELGREHTGLLLFSAVPAGGLRTTMNVVLRTADRFMREFAAIEDDGNRYEVVENVGVTYYHSAKGESPLAVLPAVIHRDPQVLVVRDLVNAETAKVLLEQAEEHRMIITTTRAKDAVDAIYRLMALGVSGDDLAKSLARFLTSDWCGVCASTARKPTPRLPRCSSSWAFLRDAYRRFTVPRSSATKSARNAGERAISAASP